MVGQRSGCAPRSSPRPPEAGRRRAARRGRERPRGRGSPGLVGGHLRCPRGQDLAVVGVDGNGQTELIEVLSGLRARPVVGYWIGDADVTRASRRRTAALGLGVIPEDRHAEGLVLPMTVAENLSLDRIREPGFSRRGIWLRVGRIQHVRSGSDTRLRHPGGVDRGGSEDAIRGQSTEDRPRPCALVRSPSPDRRSTGEGARRRGHEIRSGSTRRSASEQQGRAAVLEPTWTMCCPSLTGSWCYSRATSLRRSTPEPRPGMTSDDTWRAWSRSSRRPDGRYKPTVRRSTRMAGLEQRIPLATVLASRTRQLFQSRLLRSWARFRARSPRRRSTHRVGGGQPDRGSPRRVRRRARDEKGPRRHPRVRHAASARRSGCLCRDPFRGLQPGW